MSDGPELTVRYVDGTPVEAEFYHVIAGLMKFDIEQEDGSTVAVIDDEWDELKWKSLKDGYDPWITTEDIISEVGELPFINEVRT